MVKVLLVITATMLTVLFGIQNSDHVGVSFVVGGPKQIRLIFLLLISGTAGFLLSYIFSLNREIRLKKEVRRLIDARRAGRIQTKHPQRKVRRR